MWYKPFPDYQEGADSERVLDAPANNEAVKEIVLEIHHS